jgi:anti-sigma factor RsiW
MPVTCKELVELITGYLEGALSSEERRQFEDHLAACEGCTSYLQQMKTTITLIGGLHERMIDPHVQDELLAAFRDWKRGAG